MFKQQTTKIKQLALYPGNNGNRLRGILVAYTRNMCQTKSRVNTASLASSIVENLKPKIQVWRFLKVSGTIFLLLIIWKWYISLQGSKVGVYGTRSVLIFPRRLAEEI